MMSRRILSELFAVSVAAVLFATSSARAESLDKPACEKLRTEQATLVKEGVKADLDKGAGAAQSGLQVARLEAIKRFIAVEEDLKFRCRHGPVPVGDDGSERETPAANATAAKTQHAAKTEAGAGEAKKAQAKPKPKAVAGKSAPNEASPTDETAPSKPKAQPKPKAKAKPAPKADDDE